MAQRNIMSGGLRLLGFLVLVWAVQASGEFLRTAAHFVRSAADRGPLPPEYGLWLAARSTQVPALLALAGLLVFGSRRMVRVATRDADVESGPGADAMRKWYVWVVFLVAGIVAARFGPDLMSSSLDILGFYVLAALGSSTRDSAMEGSALMLVASLVGMAAIVCSFVYARRIGHWLHWRKTRRLPEGEPSTWGDLAAAGLGLLLALSMVTWKGCLGPFFMSALAIVVAISLAAAHLVLALRLMGRRRRLSRLLQGSAPDTGPQACPTEEERVASLGPAGEPQTERNIVTGGVRLVGIYALALALQQGFGLIVWAFEFMLSGRLKMAGTDIALVGAGRFALYLVPVAALTALGVLMHRAAPKLVCAVLPEEMHAPCRAAPPTAEWYVRACRMLGAVLLAFVVLGILAFYIDFGCIWLTIGSALSWENILQGGIFYSLLILGVQLAASMFLLVLAGRVGRWLHRRKKPGLAAAPLAGWYDLMAGLMGLFIAFNSIHWIRNVAAGALDLDETSSWAVIFVALACMALQCWMAWLLMRAPRRSGPVTWLPDGDEAVARD